MCFTGCASSPGPAPAVELTRLGEAVELAESTMAVQECEFITDLPAPPSDSDNDIAALRNQAGTAGANTVLLVTEPDGEITRAEGYLCGD